jgi:hypothetical protein
MRTHLRIRGDSTTNEPSAYETTHSTPPSLTGSQAECSTSCGALRWRSTRSPGFCLCSSGRPGHSQKRWLSSGGGSRAMAIARAANPAWGASRLLFGSWVHRAVVIDIVEHDDSLAPRMRKRVSTRHSTSALVIRIENALRTLRSTSHLQARCETAGARSMRNSARRPPSHADSPFYSPPQACLLSAY